MFHAAHKMLQAAGGIWFESAWNFATDSFYGLFGYDAEYQYYRDHQHNINQDTELSNCLYLGLILVWAIPVMMLQWYVGAESLIANAQKIRKIIFVSTMYLCISDNWAIHHDVWHINGRYILPLKMMIPPGPLRDWMGPFGTERLPFEECFFFLATSIICTWGIHLAMVVLSSWKLNLKRSTKNNIKHIAEEEEEDDVETMASKIDNAPELLWGTDEKATKQLLEKAPENVEEESLSWSNAFTAFGDVHWWGINMHQSSVVDVFSNNATTLFVIGKLIEIMISSLTITAFLFFPHLFPSNMFT